MFIFLGVTPRFILLPNSGGYIVFMNQAVADDDYFHILAIILTIIVFCMFTLAMITVIMQ